MSKLGIGSKHQRMRTHAGLNISEGEKVKQRNWEMTASAIMDSPINAWNDHWKSGSQFENSLQTQQGWKRRTEYRESIAKKTFGPSYAYDNLKQRRITQKQRIILKLRHFVLKAAQNEDLSMKCQKQQSNERRCIKKGSFRKLNLSRSKALQSCESFSHTKSRIDENPEALFTSPIKRQRALTIQRIGWDSPTSKHLKEDSPSVQIQEKIAKYSIQLAANCSEQDKKLNYWTKVDNKKVQHPETDFFLELNKPKVVNTPLKVFQDPLQKSSQNLVTSAEFEQIMENISEQFLKESEKMSVTKTKMYEKFRHLFFEIYPHMKVKQQAQKKKAESQGVNKSQIKLSLTRQRGESEGQKSIVDQGTFFMTNADEPSDSGMTMLSILQESHDRRKQKLHLKELFQQAYFWSRTKKKSICNNILSEKKQEAIEIKKVKKIKSNLTFQNYIKNRSSKELFSQRKCQIGSNMITNKSRILEIEQEGSKQQLLLKRCLEDAIEQCCKVKVEGKKPKAKAEQTMFKMWQN